MSVINKKDEILWLCLTLADVAMVKYQLSRIYEWLRSVARCNWFSKTLDGCIKF